MPTPLCSKTIFALRPLQKDPDQKNQAASDQAARFHVGRPFSWTIQETAPLRPPCEPTYPLFQNVGIFWLFSPKKADHHERRAK
jgi:hypothetical protein